MRRFASLAALFLATSALAQTPVDQLAKPPADAKHFIIQSTGGKHGDSYSWVTADGTRQARESMNLRGQVWEIDYSGKAGADGMPAAVTIRGVAPDGDVAETYTRTGNTATWKSQIDGGSAAYNGQFYATVGGPMDTNAWFLERLLASPDKTLKLLPGGTATAAKLTSLEVGTGAAKKTIDLWAISGISNSPLPLWATADGKFFGVSFGLAWLPEAYAGEQKNMEAAQAKALSAQMPALAKSLAVTPAGQVAFKNVRLFDADARKFVDDQTVLVENGLITAVGPAAKVKTKMQAQVIDGTGKTLVPGLWDSHMHFGDDSTGPMLLSIGVTSVRDPGNVTQLTIARAQRRAKGELLSPHVYASTLIDGKGPNTAQVAEVATTEAEAIAKVDKAKADGMTGVKFYGTFNPAWVKPAAAEAHKLGLHVHGHLPAGMRTNEAIDAGYDEITHIYFVLMQAMPDSVVNVSNGFARFEGPGRYAKGVDLNAEPMKSLIAKMAAKKIASDPTLVVAESLYVPENGDLSPAYAPFVGTLPPATERGFRSGGFAPPKDLTRADYRASFRKLSDLVGAMHKAGVPIVAGTDGSGLELVRELELYVAAGFTNAEALYAGTQATATLVGMGAKTGSITVGKAADLVLVDGDPSKVIGDLRHTKVVMMDGKLMDADALRAAGGFAGRPKFQD